MSDFDRRRFLQSASLLLAGSYAGRAFGSADIEVPKFAELPTFKPTGLFLTWQQDPTSTMTIQWVGGIGRRSGQFGTRRRAAPPGRSKIIRKRPFPMSDRWIFRAELTGLDAGRRLRVPRRLRFGRAPLPHDAGQGYRHDPFRFRRRRGDRRTSAHSNRLAAAQAPMFVVIGGDVAYENGRDPNTFLEFFQNYSSDLRDDQQRLIPLLTCIGNHEVDGGYKTRKEAPFFYSMFDGLYPESGYAALDFGQYMSMVFLDTNHTTPIGGQQTDWLEKTLKEREDCPNLFVFNHVPAYPSHRKYEMTEDENSTGEQNRKHWVPLFERYRVDAVFEHHDHTYKRTHPLIDSRPNANGVPYLGDGSWGKIRRPMDLETKPYLAVTEESYHISVHRIEGPQQFHVALSDSARVADVCVTKKRAAVRRS